MHSVRCIECGESVLAQKHSWEHTEVQWNRDAMSGCPRLAALAGRSDPLAVTRGCDAMRASIRAAAAEGWFGNLD